jgi:dolichol-phosphate mannosyltransferase
VSRGYVFQIETTYRAKRAGLRVREVPFTFASREQGESKLTGNVSREGILVVLRLFVHPWRPQSER